MNNTGLYHKNNSFFLLRYLFYMAQKNLTTTHLKAPICKSVRVFNVQKYGKNRFPALFFLYVFVSVYIRPRTAIVLVV